MKLDLVVVFYLFVYESKYILIIIKIRLNFSNDTYSIFTVSIVK